MLSAIFLTALVVPSFAIRASDNSAVIGHSLGEQKVSNVAAEGDKPLSDNSVVKGHSLGEQKVMYPTYERHPFMLKQEKPFVRKVIDEIEGETQLNKIVRAMGYPHWVRLGCQLLFGIVVYFLIVSKYPQLNDTQPSSLAVELQRENEVMATCKVSGSNCILSWCCSGPRAAQTFHSVGVMNYWPSLILMSLLPCCTLWCMNSQSDLNVKLGGERRGLCMGCLCACCCSCCVVAQDAEALDLTTGARTGLCGVSNA